MWVGLRERGGGGVDVNRSEWETRENSRNKKFRTINLT